MKFRRLRLVNFKLFDDFGVDLAPGLNLFVGPNESGKSAVVEAMGTVLFEDVASKALAVKALERWGTGGGMRLELGFEQGGDLYSLTKDFFARRVDLRNETGGEAKAERKLVERLIAEMVGFADRDAFESVAAVRQGELAVLEGRSGQAKRGQLVPMIERKMTSATGRVDAAGVLDRLEKEIARLQVGVARPASNPGPIRRLLDSREAHQDRVKRLSEEWGRILRGRSNLTDRRGTLESEESELSRVERALETETTHHDVIQKLRRLVTRQEEIDTKIARLRTLRQDLEDAQEVRESFSAESRASIEAAKNDIDASGRRLAELQGAASGGRTRSAARKLSVIAGGLALGSFLSFLAPASFALPSAFKWTLLGLGSLAFIAAVFVVERIVRLRSTLEELERELTNRRELELRLHKAIEKVGVPSYAEFERIARMQEERRGRADLVRAKLFEACDGRDAEQYELDLRTEATSLARQRQAYEQMFGDIETAAYLTPEDLAKLKVERDERRETVERLRGEVVRREVELEQLEAGETLPDAIARLEVVERELALEQRRLRLLETTREGLDSALATAKEEAAEVLEPIVSSVLGRITLGRYGRVSVERDLGVTVERPDNRSWPPGGVTAGDLSAGTLDQLYLATRFALLKFLSPGDGAPFILDDVLVNFDESRRAAALELLREISAERQVIMFSCEEHGAPYADKVIHLAGA